MTPVPRGCFALTPPLPSPPGRAWTCRWLQQLQPSWKPWMTADVPRRHTPTQESSHCCRPGEGKSCRRRDCRFVGNGGCRYCGAFLDPQLQHGRCHEGTLRQTHGPSSHIGTSDTFTTAAVPGRGASLDVSLGSSNAAAARGDAALVSLAHCRREIQHLRTIQLSCERCNMLACRNGQQMSSAALKHRWKHEMQIALLRWQ